MPAHLWEFTEGYLTYRIITKRNNEEQAREVFRKSLGSAKHVDSVVYIGFVDACEC